MATGQVKKLARYSTGPWIVATNPANDVMVRIVPDPTWRADMQSKVVSINCLKINHSNQMAPPPDTLDNIKMFGDKHAEYILPPMDYPDQQGPNDGLSSP